MKRFFILTVLNTYKISAVVYHRLSEANIFKALHLVTVSLPLSFKVILSHANTLKDYILL